MKKITIASPVYNEIGNIMLFYNTLKEVLKNLKYDFKLLLINDGSSDGTELKINELAIKDHSLKIINFSRNFGHQAAITAGLDYASGDAVIILDSDMQDPPSVILELINKWEKGFEVVNAKRRSRQDGNFKILTASIFYKILNLLIKNKIPENVGDYRLIDRKVVDVLKSLPEKDRYLRGLSSWVGFKQGFVEFDRDKRYSGKTHYSLSKMFGLAFDAIFSFSKLPMKLALFSSLIFIAIACVVVLYAIFSWLTKSVVAGWASLVFIISILMSLQMLVMAIISEYVGRIYSQTQNRPIYIVKDTINI